MPSRPLTKEPSRAIDGPVVDHEPELGHGDRKARVNSDHPHIARQGQLHPQPHARPLNGGDGDDRQPGQVTQDLSQTLGEAHVLELGEVGARTEVATGTREDEGPRASLHHSAHRRVQLLESRQIEGVASVLAIDGEDRPVGRRPCGDGHPVSLRPGRRVRMDGWPCSARLRSVRSFGR